MVAKNSSRLGKVLYGLLFVVIVPVLLVVWAKMTADEVRVPTFVSPPIGMGVMLVGAVVMVAGMIALIVYGKALPMNPYPPVRFVTAGIYRLLPHPIYTGFALVCLGLAIAAGSASGLWLVSPTVVLGCVALVQGYEKHDLHQRFGTNLAKPWLHLPENTAGPPTVADRASVYLLVLLPWLILYEAVRVIGIPIDAVTAYFAFEKQWPVLEWSDIFYVSTYVFVGLVPVVAETSRDLRVFAVNGLIATALIIISFLAIPLVSPPRPFSPQGFLGELLVWERGYDTAAAAFPSFHVVWALLAAAVYAGRMPSWRILWLGWAVLIAASCITTGMHAIVDVVAGFLVFLLVTRSASVWEKLRQRTERLANSWKEWRLGSIRIINHGAYAGAGAFVALAIVSSLLGPAHTLAMLLVATSIIVISAIWAQVVEGSPSLLRPYGWYGGLLGVLIGALLAGFLGTNPWLLIAAFCVGGPWVQSAGRLRCLIQGCCHGRPASPAIGIRYTHPRSRVCRLSDLTGVPIHPTPLYSILWNVVVAIAMARLWSLDAALPMIVGVNLILTGLGRFVEESYRGEPQTPIRAGLRFYQWLAIASVVAGVFTTMAQTPATVPALQVNWQGIVAAAGFGLFTWFALGVDFPNSNRRFARLA